MVMHDAIDETQVGQIPTGEAFRQRFGNPYAVIHRVDVHQSLLEGAQESGRVEFHTRARVENIEQAADREPIDNWTFGRATLLGDAAHPTTQYMAQGACMAIEDAVTLGEALRVNGNDSARAFALYQRSRIARTARIVLSSREMGRIYHAKGVERLVRNDLWRGRSPECFYDAMEWLYGWNVGNCLAK